MEPKWVSVKQAYEQPIGSLLKVRGWVRSRRDSKGISFIELNDLRRLVGGDHRVLMPLSALGGAILLLWADTLARTLARPVELPVGVITALIGAPLFLWVMRGEARSA